jgi:hypothetical protein
VATFSPKVEKTRVERAKKLGIFLHKRSARMLRFHGTTPKKVMFGGIPVVEIEDTTLCYTFCNRYCSSICSIYCVSFVDRFG